MAGELQARAALRAAIVVMDGQVAIVGDIGPAPQPVEVGDDLAAAVIVQVMLVDPVAGAARAPAQIQAEIGIRGQGISERAIGIGRRR